MDKTRVRDIASELGVANKDILQVLRNLNLAGKSHLSVLTDKEARMVKDHLTARQNKEENAGKDAIPEIIIRKRKQPAPTAVDEQSAPESIETAESAPEDDSKTKKSAPASAPAPKKTQDRHVYQAERVEPPEGKPSAEKKAPLEKQDIAAENAAASATDSSMEETHEAGPPKIGEGIDHEEADHSDLAGQQDQSLKGEAADEESKTKKKRRRKTRPEAVSGPQVKVISRPDPIEPEEKSIPQPVQGDLKSAKISFNMPLTPPIDSEEEHGPRKYRKDKRVVEFAPGLIIEEGRKSHGRRKGPESGKFHQKSKRPLPAEGQDITSHPLKAAKRKVRLEDFIRVSDMAKQMGIKAQDMIKALLNLGVIATINHPIDLDTATLVAGDFGYEVERVGFSEEKYLAPQTEDVQEDLKPRPPVVTIMGHVDHGKTSLLDSIRESNLTSREAGGITQHIGAYHVKTKRGEIVFLDTPGHAAFTAMRARGAQVTDIVVLVVAADDGVMEQTREAVNHAKAAGVPIVVAINKIDKENANPERISRELSELGLIPEDWGGETLYAKVSAKQRIGIDDLLELLALQAEVLDLKANPDKPARGHIVEAKMDKGRGPVGTVLVQEGTIRQGDIFICGNFSGRVRAMFNDQGKKVKSAGPAMPAEIQGFEGVPEAGDE
ncbi:MAG: translation initiation factor IF-2, partial [Planctomycetes bacterium]|nr:translation initiation factor IF-2 [Planctomycetota bacterium]